MSIKSHSMIRRLSCGRILKTESILISNEGGFHKCTCRHVNYFELISDSLIILCLEENNIVYSLLQRDRKA